jgi:hypothetical protein
LVVKWLFENSVEFAGDVSLEATAELAIGFAFSSASLEVILSSRVVSLTVDCDDVDRRVEVSVSSSVKAISGYEP